MYGTVSKLGDYVIHFPPQSLSYFPLNLQHPLPVLWGAGQVLAAVRTKKKMQWVSVLRHLKRKVKVIYELLSDCKVDCRIDIPFAWGPWCFQMCFLCLILVSPSQSAHIFLSWFGLAVHSVDSPQDWGWTCWFPTISDTVRKSDVHKWHSKAKLETSEETYTNLSSDLFQRWIKHFLREKVLHDGLHDGQNVTIITTSITSIFQSQVF